jgi:EAL domain-containing protein (putative c-di-GMP-specific phosphodiesterase class I)
VKLDSLLARQANRDARAATIDPERVVPLSEAVIVADHSFAVQSANDAAADLLGWIDPQSLVRDLNQVSWSIIGSSLLREIQLELVKRGKWSGQAVLERRDGSLFDGFMTACRLHAEGDHPMGVVITIRSLAVAEAWGSIPIDVESFGVKGLPGTFCLHYQPEVDLRSGSVTGCEALLRWWHPGMGMVSPGPAFAHPKWSARMAPLETWSVFAACRQAVAWADAGCELPVALNVSDRHLADTELVGRVRQALVITGLNPQHLSIDIPMTALVRSPTRARAAAQELADLGVTIVLDSVLGSVPNHALEGLPATVLKIIPGDLSDPDATASAMEAITLARSLGAVAVAKSVESADELKAVRELGFDRAFGHVFSPAIAPGEVLRTLGLQPTAASED